MPPQAVHIHNLIQAMVISHQDDPMDCEMCECNLESLAEKVAAGANLHDLLPELEIHLQCCHDCKEEFQALVCIVKAEISGELSTAE